VISSLLLRWVQANKTGHKQTFSKVNKENTSTARLRFSSATNVCDNYLYAKQKSGSRLPNSVLQQC